MRPHLATSTSRPRPRYLHLVTSTSLPPPRDFAVAASLLVRLTRPAGVVVMVHECAQIASQRVLPNRTSPTPCEMIACQPDCSHSIYARICMPSSMVYYYKGDVVSLLPRDRWFRAVCRRKIARTVVLGVVQLFSRTHRPLSGSLHPRADVSTFWGLISLQHVETLAKD